MTKVLFNVVDLQPVRDLEFGDMLIWDGKLYVKTKPSSRLSASAAKFNVVGVGHDSVAYLWDEMVTPIAEMQVNMGDS